MITGELRRSHNQSSRGSSSRLHSNEEEGNPRPVGDVQARIVRLDFHTFHGEDPIGWIYKIQHFLAFHNTLPQHKVKLASFHMDGKAVT